MTKKQSSDKQARDKQLNKALKQITKEFGKGSIMRMSDDPQHIKAIPSGSLALDNALGIGGYPTGRIVEIYGPESAGKTTLALEATAQVQKQGGVVAYIDAENALDPEYAKNLGVNIDDLLLSQPDTGEQGLQIANALIKSSAIDLVVVDSVAALVPRQEIEGEMGDSHVGLQARMMSQALRSFSGELSRTNTTIIFINQLREKVGVMFGNPETTPGGRALKFYASVRLEIRRGKKIKKGTDIIGNHAKIKITKNKVAPPFKRCAVDIMYGSGISHTGELLDMAVDKDIVKKGGAWYSYKGNNIGQGRENTKAFLANKANKATAEEIARKVYTAYNIPMPKALAQTANNQDTQENKNDKSDESADTKKDK